MAPISETEYHQHEQTRHKELFQKNDLHGKTSPLCDTSMSKHGNSEMLIHKHIRPGMLEKTSQ